MSRGPPQGRTAFQSRVRSDIGAQSAREAARGFSRLSKTLVCNLRYSKPLNLQLR